MAVPRISLVSFSFPSPTLDGRRVPIYPTVHLPLASLLPSVASPSPLARISTGALSPFSLFLSFSLVVVSLKALFLLGDKCKTKTYLPYSLCKYASAATAGWPEFFRRAFASFRLLFPPLPHVTDVLLADHTHMYTGVRRMGTKLSRVEQLGRPGCFTFPREIASKLRRRCTCAHRARVTLISRLHEYIQMSQKAAITVEEERIVTCVVRAARGSRFVSESLFPV